MCLISGGNWNNNTNAGVWNLNLNNSRTPSNSYVGFRSADYDSSSNLRVRIVDHRDVLSCPDVLWQNLQYTLVSSKYVDRHWSVPN